MGNIHGGAQIAQQNVNSPLAANLSKPPAQTPATTPAGINNGPKTDAFNPSQRLFMENARPLALGTPSGTPSGTPTATPSTTPATTPGTTPGANAPVPLAKVAEKFETTQNGQPINPAVLAKAAGPDGILTQAEAAQLTDVMCRNKETGEVLPIAQCMQKNGVSAIDLGTAGSVPGAAPGGSPGGTPGATPGGSPGGTPGGGTPSGNSANSDYAETIIKALQDLDAPSELIDAYKEQYRLLGFYD